MTKFNQSNPANKGGSWLKRLFWLFVFAGLAALTAYLAYSRTRDFVLASQMPGLEGITVKDATATPAPGEAAALIPDVSSTPISIDPPPVPGNGRVTVLMMGLDYRSWMEDQGPPLTDSMMLLTIDPASQTAGMLSIPRDLWVNIPGGYGYNRINSAYRLGEQNQLPGGGPGLAMATIEELLGVSVDYYALIEFEAFERFIDEIGGVKIDVTEKIVIDPLGDHNTKTLKKGVQTLPGNLALAYMRARKGAGDDFGRAERQQQVVLAIRNRILAFDMLPGLMMKSGQLFEELSAGIHTNLTLDQVLGLAWVATQVPEGNIYHGAIAPPTMVNFAQSPEGDEILKPIMDNVRKLRDEIFINNSPLSPMLAQLEITEIVKQEGARVSIFNGSGSADLANQTAEYWRSQGVNVVSVADASQFTLTSKITFYNPKPYTLRFLVDQLNPPDFNLLFVQTNSSPAADIEVLLGADWKNEVESRGGLITP